MTTLLLVGVALLLGLVGLIAWKVFQMKTDTNNEADKAEKQELVRLNAQLKANLEQKAEEVGSLKMALDAEKAERNEVQGKGRQLKDQYIELKAQYDQVMKDRDQLKKEVNKFEEAAERREREFEMKLSKLEAAKASLDHERARVELEEKERQKQLEDQRDRLWAEHENGVIALMTDLCKQPVFSFTSFTNTALPEGFDGSLKPDFMIEFLGQYVIFDAKVSKAKSLKTYIDDQVKKTVAKVKGNDQIYPWIFLVVPASALAELKTHHFTIDGFHLFVVSVESLPAILASLKHITRYEFAEQMDPQQRENIVHLIAELDFHINLRNAADLLLTKMGIDILDKAQKIDPALSEEVAIKKQPMNAKASIAASEIKKIVTKLTSQREETERLVSPKASVQQKDLEAAEELISGTLF